LSRSFLLSTALLASAVPALAAEVPASSDVGEGGAAIVVSADAAIGFAAPESQLWGGAGGQAEFRVVSDIHFMAGGRAQLLSRVGETHLQLGPTAGVRSGYMGLWGAMDVSVGPALELKSMQPSVYARASLSGGYRAAGLVVSSEVLPAHTWRPTAIIVRVGTVYHWPAGK